MKSYVLILWHTVEEKIDYLEVEDWVLNKILLLLLLLTIKQHLENSTTCLYDINIRKMRAYL